MKRTTYVTNAGRWVLCVYASVILTIAIAGQVGPMPPVSPPAVTTNRFGMLILAFNQAGYGPVSNQVYWGTLSGNYTGQMRFQATNEVTLYRLASGQTYFARVTAIDATGHESLPSNETSGKAGAPSPGPVKTNTLYYIGIPVTLEEATEANGKYQAVTNATLTLTLTNEPPQKFYRAKYQPITIIRTNW